MDHQSFLQTLFLSSFSSNRGMLHAARASIGALPMIAKALLAKANKPIRIIVDNRANTGSTDCESYIRLPPVPMPRNDDDVESCIDIAAIYYGLIHHEVGHCNHSDISIFRSSRQGLERALVNIIEDVRMENQHIQDLPAARAYLDALSIVMSKQGRMCTPEMDAHPGSIFTSYVMFRINALYRHEPVSKAHLVDMRTMMIATFTPEITQRLDELLEETPLLTDTRGSFNLARKVITLIQDEQQSDQATSDQNSTPESKPDAQADSNDQDQGNENTEDADTEQGEAASTDSDANADETTTGDQDTEDSDSETSSDLSNADSKDDANGEGKGAASDADAKADADNEAEAEGEDSETDPNDDANAESNGNSNTSNSNSNADASADAQGNDDASDNQSSEGCDSADQSNLPATLQEKLSSLLSNTDDSKSDRHDAANEMLQQLVQIVAQTISESLDIENALKDLTQADDTEENHPDSLKIGANHDLDSAYSTASNIRRKMLSELDTVTNSDAFVSQRGSRLSSRHLHRVISGDSRVFKTVTDGIAPNTAVMLVQDVSGSMHGEPIRIASLALYAAALALEGIDGIEVAAMAFPGNAAIIDFGQSPRFKQDRFQLSSWGCTPMGEGINVALNGLLQQPQERKLMIVLTDGEPNNVALALSMIAAAEVNGIDVYGVGILTDSVQKIFSRWIQISDINELPELLVALVRDEVMQSLAA